MKKFSRLWIILAVLVILVLGAGLRLFAANRLHIDHDETTYLIASNNYANYIRNGQLS